MNKIKVVCLVLAIFGFSLLSMNAFACGGPSCALPHAPAEKKMQIENKEYGTTTITGEVACISCVLKKEEKANTKCKIYGCKYGLNDSDGNLWSFIANDKSEDLITGKYPGEVKIIGRKFPRAQYIEVDSFEMMPKKSEEEIYSCPMHPEVTSPKPDKCPKCGMDLKKK